MEFTVPPGTRTIEVIVQHPSDDILVELSDVAGIESSGYLAADNATVRSIKCQQTVLQ